MLAHDSGPQSTSTERYACTRLKRANAELVGTMRLPKVSSPPLEVSTVITLNPFPLVIIMFPPRWRFIVAFWGWSRQPSSRLIQAWLSTGMQSVLVILGYVVCRFISLPVFSLLIYSLIHKTLYYLVWNAKKYKGSMKSSILSHALTCKRFRLLGCCARTAQLLWALSSHMVCWHLLYVLKM